MKKIGFIGAGKHAQTVHLPLYTSLEGFEVASLCDVDHELATRVAARFGIRGVYDDHRAMMAGEKLDAVVAILPGMAGHEQILTDVLEAGIPLLVEKPLCWTSVAGHRLAEKARKKGVPLAVGYHKRSDPATRLAVGVIHAWKKSGEMGPMTYARVFVSHSGDWIAGAYRGAMTGTSVPPASDPFVGNPMGLPQAGLGKARSFIGAHSHQLDLMRCLIGEPYAIAHADSSGVLLSVKSQSGVPATFEFTPYSAPLEWQEYAVVCFQKGYVRVDLPAPLAVNRPGTVEIYRGEGPQGPTRTHPVFPAKSAMHEQAESFLNFLEGKPSSLCPPQEAVESIEVAEDWVRKLFPGDPRA